MIAVVIPSYRVKKHILAVLSAIGPECELIYVVDDACPEKSGEHVEAECRDPRVRVHVEDGRHFLQTTTRRFDLITGEPPPPKIAGVVNLYTREYFQLIYERLEAGGVNTYWLPVHSMTETDAKAILRAYCDVFTDCSLWGGWGLNWMLVGSRDADWARSESVRSRTLS